MKNVRGPVSSDEIDRLVIAQPGELNKNDVYRAISDAGRIFSKLVDDHAEKLAETVNTHGDLFGDERLQERLRTVAKELSAREIRDTLLGDVWSFKADGEQLDDVTAVVAKVR